MSKSDINSTETEARRLEAEEFGCYGLTAGWARKFADHSEVNAAETTKQDGPFFCSVCYSDAIVRKCIEKRDHFAHEAPLSPAVGGLRVNYTRAVKKRFLAYCKPNIPTEDGLWSVCWNQKRRGNYKYPKCAPILVGASTEIPWQLKSKQAH